MGDVVGLPGKRDEQTGEVQAVFTDATIVKFTHKVNNFGVGVGKLEIEIESENPDVDFAPLLKLSKYYCSLGIQSGKVRIADL